MLYQPDKKNLIKLYEKLFFIENKRLYHNPVCLMYDLVFTYNGKLYKRTIDENECKNENYIDKVVEDIKKDLGIKRRELEWK